MISIILVDDHQLVRDGIKALLEDESNIRVIDEASDGEDVFKVLEKKLPDLLVVDIRMPKRSGIEVVQKVKIKYPHLKTLMLSMHDSEEYVVKSIEAGADGYLLKGSSKEEFLKAIQTIAEGSKSFTGDISSIIMDNFVTGRAKEGTPAKDKIYVDKYHLTKRERQILRLVLEGKSNKNIADNLQISKRTTEVHRFNLMKKLGARNAIELSKKAEEQNLL